MKDLSFRIIVIVNITREYSNDITDKRIIEKVLKSTNFKFEYVVAIIEESKDSSKLYISELISLKHFLWS